MKAKDLVSSELRKHLRDVLRDVEQGKRVRVLHFHRPVAALVPIEDLERLEALDRRKRVRK